MSATKLWEKEVPFDQEGNLLAYFWDISECKHARKVPPFQAVMYINDYYRGRSAAGFELKDGEGRTYPMQIKVMLELLQKADLSAGLVKGWWGVIKRGANFSVVYLGTVPAQQ